VSLLTSARLTASAQDTDVWIREVLWLAPATAIVFGIQHSSAVAFGGECRSRPYTELIAPEGDHETPQPERQADGTREQMPPWLPRAMLLFLLSVAALFMVAWLIRELGDLLLILLISLFLAFALEPAVNFLARRGWRRGAATGVIFLALVVAVAGFVAAMSVLVVDQVSSFADDAESYGNQIEEYAKDWFDADIDVDEASSGGFWYADSTAGCWRRRSRTAFTDVVSGTSTRNHDASEGSFVSGCSGWRTRSSSAAAFWSAVASALSVPRWSAAPTSARTPTISSTWAQGSLSRATQSADRISHGAAAISLATP
jgi:AI-2E family transporter